MEVSDKDVLKTIVGYCYQCVKDLWECNTKEDMYECALKYLNAISGMAEYQLGINKRRKSK